MPDEPTDDALPGEPAEPEPRDLDGLRGALANERRAHKTTRTELERLRTTSDEHTATADARVAAANVRLLHAEIRAQASAKLADPADAIRLLDLDTFAVDDDGNVDHEAIDAALDQLVEAKPYLAKTKSPPKVPQGARGGPVPTPARSGDDWLRDVRDRR